MVTDDEFRRAEARSRRRQRSGLVAAAAHFDGATGMLVIQLRNRCELHVPSQMIQEIAEARPSDLREIVVSSAGTGVHFPRIDADVYVPGLLAGVFGTRAWMAAQLGAAGGRSTSPAKRAASRTNGRKGGRPRKKAALPA
jgi:hypothetical protein